MYELKRVSVILLLVFASTPIDGQTVTFVTTEPAPVSFASLFKQADIVAQITIRSGDAENYNAVIYKAEVLDAYKGTKTKELIYFGPYVSYEVGGQYLVFLKKTSQKLAELIDRSISDARLPYDSLQNYYRIMYQGYSVMPVDYLCLFEGKDIDKCDYGVKFNTYQVELPKTLKTFPKNVGDFREEVKWVRQSEVKTQLRALASGP